MSEDRWQLRVNPIRCDGAGYCAEILPERLALDEWGFPVADDTPITDARQLRLARRAVGECPRLALLLQRSDPGRRR